MGPASPQTLRRLTYFATIAEMGSIRAAAERLGLSVPVVSEALSELEAELGVTLANRTTRRFELTEAGRDIQATAAEILRLGQVATQYAHPDHALSGRLAITLPVELATQWIAPYLATFQAQHSQVRFEIDASDKVTALKNSPYDLAIRTGYVRPGASVPDCPCLPLSCVARDVPKITLDGDKADLQLPLIGPHPERGLLARDRVSGEDLVITSPSGLSVNNRGVAIAMAMQGLGVSLVVEASVVDLLKQGRLVRVLPGHDFGAISLQYVFRDALPSPPAKAFVAWLREKQIT